MSHVQNPPRWLETDELPPELRSELSAYVAEAPNVARRARMLESLEQQLGFAEVSAAELSGTIAKPALGGVTGAGAGAIAGSLVKLKLVLGLLATAGAALGTWAIWSSAQSAPTRTASFGGDVVSSPAPFRAVRPDVTRWAFAEVVPALAEPASVLPTLESRTPNDGVEAQLAPAPVARRERKSTQSVRASAQADVPSQHDSSSDTPSVGVTTEPLSELTLLARARRSLLTSPVRSLELAEQHARDFPAGTLCEEREVLAIESLLKLGRVDLAKRRALVFERSFPSSAHRAHLARLIARPLR